MILEAKEIFKTYGVNTILDRIDMSIEERTWVGVLGPNGSGKSTLLKCLTGNTKIDQGEVRLKGKSLATYSVKERAKMIAFLTQEALPILPNTVEEVVLMGRYPYQRTRWPWYQKQDMEIVKQIMQFTDLYSFRHRQIAELSGGERQRVAMAMALAQEPEILILDEPTTFLDVYYQLSLFDLLKSWQEVNGTTIISVLHDLNLASLYSDRLFFLKDGQLVYSGTTREIVTKQKVDEVFAIEPIIVDHPVREVPQILLKGGDE